MRSKLTQQLVVLTVMLLAAVPAIAQVVVPPAIETSIEDGVALVGLIIAIGGAGYLVIASAGTAWTVGAKFIKRLAGKA